MIQKCQQYLDNYITGLRGRRNGGRWTGTGLGLKKGGTERGAGITRDEKLASSCAERRRDAGEEVRDR